MPMNKALEANRFLELLRLSWKGRSKELSKAVYDPTGALGVGLVCGVEENYLHAHGIRASISHRGSPGLSSVFAVLILRSRYFVL